MTESSPNDEQSDLWISLDEAVIRSGLSRRTILDWSRSGKVKREKRKGKVFLWVSDLATLTPLARVEPEVDEVSTPEVLPSVTPENYGGSNIVQIKLMGDQLKENLEKQEEVLGHVVELQSSLQKLEGKEVLDERTKKELSLLGNVFRSLHQQNEKVNLALVSQKEAIEIWQSKQEDRENLIKKVEQSDKKASHWLFALLSASALFGLMIFWIFREWQHDQVQSMNKVSSLEKDRSKLEKSLEKEKLELDKVVSDNDSKIKALQESHEEKIDELNLEHTQSAQRSKLEQQTQLREQQDKFLSFIEQKDKQFISQLAQQKADFESFRKETESKKKEEIERLEKAHQKVVDELKKSELEKWENRESEVKNLLDELKNAKGSDQKKWLQRLEELDDVLGKMQDSAKQLKAPKPVGEEKIVKPKTTSKPEAKTSKEVEAQNKN